MEALRKFVSVVVRIELGAQVDVALRLPERAEIAPDVLRLRRSLDHRGDHEGGVDDLAEAKLFGEVVGTVEERGRLTPAVKQRLHAVKQHAVLEGQLDPASGDVLLERLDGGIVAAGLEAD